MIVAAAALAPAALAADPPLATQFAAPVPTVSADLNITVILAGIPLTGSERSALLGKIHTTWWPFISAVKVPIGVNFTVHADLVDAPPEFMAAYAQHLNDDFANDTISRALGNYIGVYDNVSAYFPSWDLSTPVRHADAERSADWLAASADAFPSLAPSPGEARIVFLNPESITEPYYYKVDSLERDRGTTLTYETANAWGDDGGVWFQDLRALPSHLGEFSGQGRPGNFAGFPPYWSYGASTSERDRLVSNLAYYIDTTVEQLIAPSFGVAPFEAASITLDITVLDATSAGTALVPGGVGSGRGIEGLDDVLNTALVEAALRDLVPYSTITAIGISTTSAIDQDLKSAVEHASSTSAGATIVDPFGLEASLRDRWDVPSLPIEPGEDVTVPAILIITDGPSFVDAKDVRGVTLQRSDGRAAGIVIAAGLEQLEERAFTETVIHESGHALGFGHPHEISVVLGNGTVFTQVDWLRSLTSTPMTYLPSYVDYTFDAFDRHALWEGVAAITLGEAFQLRQAAYARLDTLGYNRSNIPAAVLSHEDLFQSYANSTIDLLARGILYIDANPPFSAGGAIMMAKAAYDEAKAITTRVALTPRCCGGHIPGFLPGFDAAPLIVAMMMAAAAATVVRARRV